MASFLATPTVRTLPAVKRPASGGLRLTPQTILAVLLLQAFVAWSVFMVYHEVALTLTPGSGGGSATDTSAGHLRSRPGALWKRLLASGIGGPAALSAATPLGTGPLVVSLTPFAKAVRRRPSPSGSPDGSPSKAAAAAAVVEAPAPSPSSSPASAAAPPAVPAVVIATATAQDGDAPLPSGGRRGKEEWYAGLLDQGPLPPGYDPPYTVDWKGKTVDSDFAYVTLVSGNSAARHAIALLQSLKEVGTQYPVVVMLSRGGIGTPECHDNDHRRKLKRPDNYRCDANDTVAEEIVSPPMLSVMDRLGARIVITDEIPRTPYTATIAGGRNLNWGMSLNKLQIFNMTQFKKIIFMDADTMAFKNLDHLFGPEYPMFSAAMTYSCCNVLAAPTMSGGFWIVEPHPKWGVKLWDLMVEGKPQYYRNGTQIFVNGSAARDEWYLSDLDLVRAAFSVWDKSLYTEATWPEVHDLRHGTVPGLRRLPAYANMTDKAFQDSRRGKGARENTIEGFNPNSPLWDGKTPVFRALDIAYDQCVGNCACLPDRDLKEDYMSVHFSCIPDIIHKPSWYETEEKFMEDMFGYAESCTRWYFVEKYYGALLKAGFRLDKPYYTGPPVPIWNATHDVFVRFNKAEYARLGIQRRWL